MGVWCQEYEGLTNKIHDLQTREQHLHEVLSEYQSVAAAADASGSVLMMSSGDHHHQAVGSMSPAGRTDLSLSHPASTSDEDSSATSTSGGKTPMRGIVRAYLPKKMTTVVSPSSSSSACGGLY